MMDEHVRQRIDGKFVEKFFDEWFVFLDQNRTFCGGFAFHSFEMSVVVP